MNIEDSVLEQVTIISMILEKETLSNRLRIMKAVLLCLEPEEIEESDILFEDYSEDTLEDDD